MTLGMYTQRHFSLMSKHKIDLSSIVAYFEPRSTQVYACSDFAELQSTHFRKWRLPPRMGSRTFIELLLDQTKLSELTLKSPDYDPLLR